MESAWNLPVGGDPSLVVFQKIRATCLALQKWNRLFFGNIQETIKRLSNELVYRQSLSSSEDNLAAVYSLKLALDKQMRREEIFWRQKSRVEWLVSSNLNTRYFHASTVTRRCHNQIPRLKQSDGSLVTGWSMIGNSLVAYFQELYSSSLVFLHIWKS